MMKNLIKKFIRNKKAFCAAGLFLVVLAVFVFPYPASVQANGSAGNQSTMGAIGTAILNLGKGTIIATVGLIAEIVVWVNGTLIMLTTKVIVSIAPYNNFIKEKAIIDAWVIVRNICNMFFILVLLIIAFATILRVENYSAKKLLPKLIIMAFLINFSRMFCGLAIDFGQILMLTFVNSFAGAEGNGWQFVQALQVQDFLNVAWSTFDPKNLTSEIDLFSIVGGMVLGCIFMIISLVVMLMLMGILVIRIVMLWILVVLSPLAFLLSAFPGGQGYAAQWRDDFVKQIFIGPVLAFFIWLSLAASNGASEIASIGGIGSEGTAAAAGQGCFGPAGILCPGLFLNFVISIGMLIGGMMMAEKMGGMAGGAVAKVAGWSKQAGILQGKGMRTLRDYGLRKFAASKHGWEMRPSKVIAGIKENLERVKRKDEQAAQIRGAELLGRGGWKSVLGSGGAGAAWANQYVTGFMNLKGFKNMGREVFTLPAQREKLKESIEKRDKEVKAVDSAIIGLGEVQTVREEADRKKRLENINKTIAETKAARASETDENKKKILNKQLESLEASKKKLEEEIAIPVNLDKSKLLEQRDALLAAIKADKAKLFNIQPPKAIESRIGYRGLVNEEKSKIKDVTNADELIQYYRDAVRKGEKYRAAAIAEKLFNDANGNELLNDFGYSSTAVGLHEFMQNEVVEKNLMSPQEALQMQNDLSEAAERVNHWDMAKTVGVNSVGELVSLIKKDEKTGKWDDSEHATAALAEIMKMDPQAIMRALNRLAFGGETPDENGVGRTFNLSTLGRALVASQARVFEDHSSRLQPNVAFNLSQPHVVEQMKESGAPSSVIRITGAVGVKEGKNLSPGNVVGDIADRGLNLTEPKKGAKQNA